MSDREIIRAILNDSRGLIGRVIEKGFECDLPTHMIVGEIIETLNQALDEPTTGLITNQ